MGSVGLVGMVTLFQLRGVGIPGYPLVLEEKWYTYAIHAIKAKIHAFQQQHVTQVMGLSFWSHPFYNNE